MSIPLLATKLYLPRTHSECIQRPRLVEKLEVGLKKKITLISAPPGFGKTTTLTGWLEEKKRQVAWLSLDTNDNDLSRFLSYLIAAFNTLGKFYSKEEFGELSAGTLHTGQTRQAELVLTTLINEMVELAETVDPKDLPLLLVLDDYHVVTEQAIHNAVEFLISGLPPSLHLIISSRVDPDLSLARWRIQDQVSELRAADLRFLSTEISEFFLQILGEQLSGVDIASLETRTEGWVAGLKVAALSMRERSDISSFIQAFTGSNRYILDFLVEEVLEQLPVKVQDFLLKTSILERLYGPLCDFLTRSTDSQALLETLERDNIFLDHLGDQSAWYRYHQLFGEFLRTQLSRKSPEKIPQLHYRASIWLEENGYLPEAIEHALISGNTERSAPLVEKVSREAIERGEWGTLQRWLSALGKEQLSERPGLCLARAWSLLYTGSQQETAHWLDIAEGYLPTINNQDRKSSEGGTSQESELETGRLAGEILALRATLASMLGDTRRTIELGNRSLAYIPEDDEFLRSAVISSIGYAHRYKGEVAEAKNAFQQAIRLSKKSGNWYQALDGLCNLANMQMLEGEYNGAKDTINTASGIVRLPSRKPSPIACEVYLLDGVYSYELNDLNRAEESIQESIQLNTAQRIIELQYAGRVWLSRVLRAKGDFSGAIEQIERAEQLAARAKLWRFQAHTSAIRAELSTFLGDIERARHWASNLDKSRASRPVELPRMDEFEDIILAHVYLAMKMPDCIPDLLKSRLVKAELSGRMDSVYRMTAYLSLAQAEIGDMDRALENMKWLLPKVAVQGYTRLFLDCGQEMADLLRQMNVAGIEPAYTRQLLVAFSEDSLMGENQHPPSSLLSNREQEVLILISAGYSNREIGDELVITMGTVKRHVSNIYGKLNVSSRTQALAVARELHLLN